MHSLDREWALPSLNKGHARQWPISNASPKSPATSCGPSPEFVSPVAQQPSRFSARFSNSRGPTEELGIFLNYPDPEI
jgi:hypothetical protein